MSAPDPDVRVVVLGIPQKERELARLFDQRAEAERLADDLARRLLRIERELKRLEQELKRG